MYATVSRTLARRLNRRLRVEPALLLEFSPALALLCERCIALDSSLSPCVLPFDSGTSSGRRRSNPQRCISPAVQNRSPKGRHEIRQQIVDYLLIVLIFG